VRIGGQRTAAGPRPEPDGEALVAAGQCREAKRAVFSGGRPMSRHIDLDALL